MARTMKIDYDLENDLLWLHDGRKVVDSLQMDSFTVDFAKGGDVSGIEISNASKFISRLSPTPISKEAIGNIKSAAMKTYREKELVYLIFLIKIEVKKEIVSIPIQVNTPTAVMMVRN
ncbi:MAG: DUF2283 domain-containing protein [Candidatus Micrarchaeota archaeon]|nr:DUF2283 domain-containing protein [Candidatus Micrarchaeota archaeon]